MNVLVVGGCNFSQIKISYSGAELDGACFRDSINIQLMIMLHK